MFRLSAISIRGRLLVVSITILLIGFGSLTLVAGAQISSAARVDYTTRLQNEVILIAQGAASPIAQRLGDSAALAELFAVYETQTGSDLRFVPRERPGPRGGPGGNPPAGGGPGANNDEPEIDAALRGETIVLERRSASGELRFYTAARVAQQDEILGALQLSVPTRSLQSVVIERWLQILLVFAAVLAAAVAAAVWLARSIIQPLEGLRASAARLAQGDLKHRAAYTGKDEIGAVAAAFNHMAGQVESMLEEQRAFASNTAHELRTPLTTIRLRTEALRYDPSLEGDAAAQYITEIDEEIIRLSNLVQDLTLLSRFDAGRAELGQEQVDLRRFASNLAAHMAETAAEKQIALTLTLPEAPLTISASLTHLTVIFRNLLENAIKYTPEGGMVTWDVQVTAGGSEHLIRDTGRGIDAAHLPHVFERFFRGDKSRSREVPGTGLGLALVKSILEAYGGTVTLHSEGVGKGTTARVFLPETPR